VESEEGGLLGGILGMGGLIALGLAMVHWHLNRPCQHTGRTLTCVKPLRLDPAGFLEAEVQLVPQGLGDRLQIYPTGVKLPCDAWTNMVGLASAKAIRVDFLKWQGGKFYGQMYYGNERSVSAELVHRGCQELKETNGKRKKGRFPAKARSKNPVFGQED
jgi:hypothetical protein